MSLLNHKMNETIREKLPGLKIPSHTEIEAGVSPYITKRMSTSDPEWRQIYEREAHKERKIYRKQKIQSLLPWARYARPQTLVSDHYETHWSEMPWPRTRDPKPGEKTIVSIWGDEGMLIRRHGRKRVHHLLFARLVRELKPRSALEVGFGNGINLLVMSTLFPDIKWSGVELTEAGLRTAMSVQKEAQLPTVLQEFSTIPIVDPSAHRNVTFRQGDASKLPFRDGEFDLVFSFLALEQMQSLRDKVLSEIARVSSRYVICTEPFRDCNQSTIQKHYRDARGYLDLSVAELPAFGLQPFFIFDDWPQKLNLGAALVAAEVIPG
jgi:SAM-dependent methyltransferase